MGCLWVPFCSARPKLSTDALRNRRRTRREDWVETELGPLDVKRRPFWGRKLCLEDASMKGVVSSFYESGVLKPMFPSEMLRKVGQFIQNAKDLYIIPHHEVYEQCMNSIYSMYHIGWWMISTSQKIVHGQVAAVEKGGMSCPTSTFVGAGGESNWVCWLRPSLDDPIVGAPVFFGKYFFNLTRIS